MNGRRSLLTGICLAVLLQLQAQQSHPDAFDKANNAVNKVAGAIAVFQPLLLKARQIYYDGRQLANDTRNAVRNQIGKQPASSTPSYNANGTNNQAMGNTAANTYPNNQVNTPSYGNQGTVPAYNSNDASNGNMQPNAAQLPNYLPGQNLPVNNPAAVNNDGSGNWGNQNNGLYGNCLDVLTGTVLGMGEATQTPTAVDLMFFAPADGQNTFVLMTPGFARNNASATYMSEHASEPVAQWSDVNESELALTSITLGQFNQIQNNSQIQNAVRNARDYAGYYSSVGQKLDGRVFAVKVQMENRETYALVAVLKQIGTSGSNGYLRIQIKSTGMAAANGQINVNAYQR